MTKCKKEKPIGFYRQGPYAMTDAEPQAELLGGVTVQDFERHQARLNAVALEALKEVLHRIPFGTKITLSEGKTATIEKFVEPSLSEDGTPKCGFDVRFADGSHIEFFITQTGWESAPWRRECPERLSRAPGE